MKRFLLVLMLSAPAMAQQTAVIPDCTEPLPFSCPAQNFACWDSEEVIHRCVIGQGWTSHLVGEGIPGGVNSFNTRQGDVVSIAGDYAHDGLTGKTATDHHVPTVDCTQTSCNLFAGALLDGDPICSDSGAGCGGGGGSGNMIKPAAAPTADQIYCTTDTDGAQTKICTVWDMTLAQDSATPGATFDDFGFTIVGADPTKNVTFDHRDMATGQAVSVRVPDNGGASGFKWLPLFVEDPPDVSLNVCTDLNGYLTTTNCPVDTDSVSPTRWTYQSVDQTPGTDPGVNQFETNNTDFTLSTQFDISVTSANGINVTTAMTGVLPGDQMYLQQETTSINAFLYNVVSVVNNLTFISYVVTFAGQGTGAVSPTNGDVADFAFISLGAKPGGPDQAIQFNGGGTLAGNEDIFVDVSGGPDTGTIHADGGFSSDPSAQPGQSFQVTGVTAPISGQFYFERNGSTPGANATPNIDFHLLAFKSSAGELVDWLGIDSEATGNDAFNLQAGSIGPVEIDKTLGYDWSSASSFQVPVNTGRSLPNAGEVLVDTTENQFIYESGGGERVVIPDDQLCMRFDDLPVSSTGEMFYKSHRDLTIISGSCTCNGTCGATAPVLDFKIRDLGPNTTRDPTGDITCQPQTTATTPQAFTAITDVPGGDLLEFDTNALTDTDDSYIICVSVKYDRK